MASETDGEVLERYKLTRDRILAAIQAGDQTVELRGAGGKGRTVAPTLEWLDFIERKISALESKTAAASEGRVRNYVEFHRR